MNKKAQYSRLINPDVLSNNFSINLDKISDVRELLIKTSNPDLVNEYGEPAWLITIKNKNFFGLEELINNNVDVNQLNNNNDSWLISCLIYNVPIHILNIGLKKSDNDKWYLPNNEGVHPFFHNNMNSAVANIICMKWWGSLKNWNRLKYNNEYPEEYFRNINKDNIADIFEYWHKRCSFLNNKQITK